MKHINTYKAIIFDFDGTMVDSLRLWESIDEIFLSRYGLDVPKDLHEKIAGMSFQETAEYFKQRFSLTESIDEIMQIWNDLSYQSYLEHIDFKPGAKAYIQNLKSAGFKLGIATSNIPKTTQDFLAAHDILDLFDAICYTGDEISGKPDPEVYLEAAKRLHVDPKNCLAFEDTYEGILSAKAADMDVVAVDEQWTEMLQRKIKALSDEYIYDFLDLPEMLKIEAEQ